MSGDLVRGAGANVVVDMGPGTLRTSNSSVLSTRSMPSFSRASLMATGGILRPFLSPATG